MTYARQIKVSVNAGEEILDKTEIKNVLMEMLKCDNETEYNIMKAGGVMLQVDIITKDTKVSINGGLYNDLLKNCVYSTGDYTKVTSIKFDASVEATFIFSQMEG